MSSANRHKLVDLNESIKLLGVTHAAHCLLYFKEKDQCHDDEAYSTSNVHYGLIQVRSDGYIGFPGGEVDENVQELGSRAILLGLHRELEEEINYPNDQIECRFDLSNYVSSHYVAKAQRPLVCHFFAKQLTREQFQMIERTHTMARDFPSEQLGLFRVPIWTDSQQNMTEKNAQFWKSFINFPFIGNSREQFILACEHVKVTKVGALRLLLDSIARPTHNGTD